MDDFYRTVGARVREARDAAGLSQEQLALRIGLSRASVANIERGAQRVALHQWLELAAAIGVDPMQLLPGSADRDENLQRALRTERVPVEVARWIETAVQLVERDTDRSEGREVETDGTTSGSTG